MNKYNGAIFSFELNNGLLLIKGNYDDKYIIRLSSIQSVNTFWNSLSENRERHIVLGIEITTTNGQFTINAFDSYYEDGAHAHEDPDRKETSKGLRKDMDLLFDILSKNMNT